MKRFLSFILVLALLLSIMPTGLSKLTVNAVSTAESGGYTYEVHDEKATITGCTWTNASYLEIPRTIDGYPVVAIDPWAFALCEALQAVSFP